jgi:hypothetical protein
MGGSAQRDLDMKRAFPGIREGLLGSLERPGARDGAYGPAVIFWVTGRPSAFLEHGRLVEGGCDSGK